MYRRMVMQRFQPYMHEQFLTCYSAAPKLLETGIHHLATGTEVRV